MVVRLRNMVEQYIQNGAPTTNEGPVTYRSTYL